MVEYIGCTRSVFWNKRDTPYTALIDHKQRNYYSFLAELREKHDVGPAVFLSDGSHSLKDACPRHEFDFRYGIHGTRNSVKDSIY